MKLDKKHLPFYAASVQTIQYGFAGFLYFSWVGVFVVGSMGALISFSTAYAASQISDIAKGRKTASWAAMIALMLLSPVIIGTSLFYSLDVITAPVWRGIVSAVWGILPDGATALAGFIAGKGLVATDNKPTSKPKKVVKPLTSDPEEVVKPLLNNNNLLAYIDKHPEKSNRLIGEYFGVSAQAIQQRRADIKERAEIAHAFQDGVK